MIAQVQEIRTYSPEEYWLFRILYAGLAGINEFWRLSAFL
jgi:hypothetical protein